MDSEPGAGPAPGEPSVSEEPAELRREFREGLGARLDRMRDALTLLEDGFAREAAERLYRAAHSLQGTATAFGARELGERAAPLAELARGWLRSKAVEPDQVEEAARHLRALSRAVKAHRADGAADPRREDAAGSP